MGTSSKNAASEPVQAQAAAVPGITLDEFCQRLSRTDKRVELIAGFHADESSGGRLKDAEDQYLARFAAFINKPV